MMTQEWGSEEPPAAVRKPASTAARVAVRLIDSVVLSIILVLGIVACVRPLSAVFDDSVTTTPAIWVGPVMFLAGVGIIVHWLWAWAARDGRSPGRAVMGLQLVGDDGHPIGHKAVAVRFLVRGALEGFLPLIGTVINFIVLARSDEGQALHDKVVNARVLEALMPQDVEDDTPHARSGRAAFDNHEDNTGEGTADSDIESRWPGFTDAGKDSDDSAYSLPDPPRVHQESETVAGRDAEAEQPAPSGLGAFVKQAHREPDVPAKTTKLSKSSRPAPKPAPLHVDVTDEAVASEANNDEPGRTQQLPSDKPTGHTPADAAEDSATTAASQNAERTAANTAADTTAGTPAPSSAKADSWAGDVPIEVVDDNDDIELVEVSDDAPVAKDAPSDEKPAPKTSETSDAQIVADAPEPSTEARPGGLGAAKKAVEDPDNSRWSDPTSRTRNQPDIPATPSWPLKPEDDADQSDQSPAEPSTAGDAGQVSNSAAHQEAAEEQPQTADRAERGDSENRAGYGDQEDEADARSVPQMPAADTGENQVVPPASPQPVQNPFDDEPLPSKGSQTFRKQDVSPAAAHTGGGPQLRRKRNAWTLIGQDSEQTIVIDTKVLLGRRPQAAGANLGDARAVPVYDQTLSVSKSHALLGIDDEGLWIVDWGSRNGTFIAPGGEAWEALQPQQPYRLLQGDLLRLGNVDFDVRKDS